MRQAGPTHLERLIEKSTSAPVITNGDVTLITPTLPVSNQLYPIAPGHVAAPNDSRVDPDVALVLLDRGAEHGGILGQAGLAQRRHDAAGTWAVDPQLHLAERQRPPDPAVLDEALLGRVDDEV